MNNADNIKVLFLVNIFVHAIMGMSVKAENVVFEILSDDYTHEKMKIAITNVDEQFVSSIIAILAGNGSVCEALNCMPGTGEEKRRVINERIWLSIFNYANYCPHGILIR